MKPRYNTLKLTSGTRSSGQPYWSVSGQLGGDRVRKQFPTKKEAEVFLANADAQVTGGQKSRMVQTILTPKELELCEAGLAMLRLKGYTGSLLKVFESFDVEAQSVKPISWEDAVEEWIAWRVKYKGIKPITSYSDEKVLKSLTAGPVSRIDLEALKSEVYSPRRSPRTQRDYRDLLHNFFQWLKHENYTHQNPIAEWVRPKVEKQEVVILNHSQVRLLLDHAEQMLPYFSICLFSGVRPHEARRLTWEDIDFKARCIWVRHGRTKTRRGAVRLHKNLSQILTYSQANNLQPGYYYRPLFDSSRKAAGILHPEIWVNDVCRHTYASNRYQALVNQGTPYLEVISDLVRNMRTDQEMLWSHYITQLVADDPTDYLKIVPECLGRSDIRCDHK